MDEIETARLQLENSKNLFTTKGDLFDEYYQNSMYVKKAGYMAYNGVLVALDKLILDKLKIKTKKVDSENGHIYRDYLGKINKNILIEFNTCYNILLRTIGYYGEGNYTIVSRALECAEYIIDLIDAELKMDTKNTNSLNPLLKIAKKHPIKIMEGFAFDKPRMKKVEFDTIYIIVHLHDGRIIYAPLNKFPSIERVPKENRMEYDIFNNDTMLDIIATDEVYHIRDFLGIPEKYLTL